MKSKIPGLAAVFIAAAAALTFSACSGSSSAVDVKEQLSSMQTTRITAKNQNEGKVLTLGYQPGGDMTKEDFEAGTASYTVYDDGKVIDEKTNEEKTLSADELAKAKALADKLLNHELKTINQGDDMPSYSVIAYDEQGATHSHEAQSGVIIEGFDEVYKIVIDKFSK